MKIADIIKEVAEKAGYTFEQILEDDRTKRITFVRQYAMWRARKETNRSLEEIAMVFKRHHTTVLYAYQKFEKMSEVERLLLPKQTVKKRKVPAIVFLGMPCKHGHGELRYFSSLRCVTCSKLSRRRRK